MLEVFSAVLKCADQMQGVKGALCLNAIEI